MNKFALTLAGIVLLSLTAVAEEPADYKLEVLDFSELKVTNNVNVDYICSADSAGWAYFTCPPATASKLMFTNNKACLHIQTDSDGEPIEELPTIRVYSSGLTKVENSSDSTIRILSNVVSPNFKARVVGNGTLIVNNVETSNFEASVATGKGHVVIYNGKARQATLSSVGTGPIEAGRLTAQKVKAVLFGTGDIDCTALDQLSIYGAGAGKVYYAGNPTKIVNRGLGIKAFPLEQSEADAEKAHTDKTPSED